MWRLIIVGLIFTITCKRSLEKGDIPNDTYKSPYLPITEDISRTPADIPQPEQPQSMLHPAAKDRPYPLMSIQDLALNDQEKELLMMMADPKKGGEVLERLKAAGPRALTLIRMALTATNKNIRMQSALLLANMKDISEETVAVLCDSVLYDPDPDVRATSAKAFVVIKAPSATDTLIRSLLEDPFETARANAAWALGNNPGKGVVDALKKALSDKDTWVRLRAVSALKKLNARQAIPEIKERACDQNAMVRERAEETLRAWGIKLPSCI